MFCWTDRPINITAMFRPAVLTLYLSFSPENWQSVRSTVHKLVRWCPPPLNITCSVSAATMFLLVDGSWLTPSWPVSRRAMTPADIDPKWKSKQFCIAWNRFLSHTLFHTVVYAFGLDLRDFIKATDPHSHSSECLSEHRLWLLTCQLRRANVHKSGSCIPSWAVKMRCNWVAL